MGFAGVPLFLANAAVSAWIKFLGNEGPAEVVTALIGAALIYLAFSHVKWVRHVIGDPSPTLVVVVSCPTSCLSSLGVSKLGLQIAAATAGHKAAGNGHFTVGLARNPGEQPIAIEARQCSTGDFLMVE